MQSVKLFMRVVGVPNPEAGIKSGAEVEEELEYKFLSQGYKIHESHYLGPVNGSFGYSMLFVLVKDEPEPEPAKIKK